MLLAKRSGRRERRCDIVAVFVWIMIQLDELSGLMVELLRVKSVY